jgi:hypothetical protein
MRRLDIMRDRYRPLLGWEAIIAAGLQSAGELDE